MSRREAKAEARSIDAILRRDWDRIGAGALEDECKSFVWPIHKLLIEGAPRDRFEPYLRWAADQHAPISAPEERLRGALDNLLALRLARTEGKCL